MDQTDKTFFKISIIIIVGFIGVTLLQLAGVFTLTDVSYPCAFRSATGFFCPGCGGTHAVIELASGHILRSILIHPFVLYVLICALGFVTLNTIALARGKGYFHFHMLYVYIGLAILFIQWIAKNIWLLTQYQN